MKTIKLISIALLSLTLVATGCKSWSKTAKGAVIGTAAGAALGAGIGKVAGNTAVGAAVGAAVGGATGAIIGHKMDKQAEELKKQVPNASVERVGEGIVVEFSDKILFDTNSSTLSMAAKANLDKMMGVFTTYPDTDIEIQGHTDNTGSEEYNQKLSDKRAAAVASYLMGKGIASSRLVMKGYGELAPKYSNDTADGRSQNRRVEFVITANAKMKADAERESRK